MAKNLEFLRFRLASFAPCANPATCWGVTSYATRIRREVIDIAGKIIRTGGEVILKITEATFERLDLRTLWDRTADPPRFCWA